MNRITAPLVVAVCALVVAVAASQAADERPGKKKKIKKGDPEYTEVLELPKDPPSVVTAETRRLVFQVSPLSARGLLSAQTRDALRALIRTAEGAQIVRVRAFVAGTGDMRRIAPIVSEIFTEKKLPLPAVTVVQAGGLPLEGAQVVIESTAMAKKEVNPNGLAWFSGQQETGGPPIGPVLGLAEKSIANLRKAMAAVNADPAEALAVSCFVSSLEDAAKVRAALTGAFPKATLNYVQTQRGPSKGIAECEAVARPGAAASSPVTLVNPPGMTQSPNYSQIAVVSAPRVALSGAHAAFGGQESDARLAFQRLEKDLAAMGATLKDTAFSRVYPIAESVAETVRKVRFDFYDRARPPASTLLPFEGLPSMDSTFSLDVIVPLNK